MRLLLLVAFLGARAWACSCAVSPAGDPPCQSTWRHAAVFTGTVTAIDDPGMPTVHPGQQIPDRPLSWPRKKVTFRIDQAVNGLDAKQQEVVIETGLGGGDCGYNFVRGRDYVVYADKGPNGALSTGICSPTRPLQDAAEDLAYFRRLPQAPPTAEVRVQTLPALSGVRIVLGGPGGRREGITDASGRSVFANLPPGEYRVEGSLEGYAGPDQSRPVQAPAKGCAEVPLPLHVDRRLTGQVFHKDGRLASGITVEAVRKGEQYAAASAVTGADGRYLLNVARSGDYHLGVSLTQPPTPKYPYTRWFYPGTEDPAKAAVIQLTDTPTSQRFDLTIPEPQQERVIRGVVLWPDGTPVEHASVHLEDPRWPMYTRPLPIEPGGRFTLQALDGTRYRVYAMSLRNNAPFSTEPLPVEPGREALDLKLVLTRPGRPAPAAAPPR